MQRKHLIWGLIAVFLAVYVGYDQPTNPKMQEFIRFERTVKDTENGSVALVGLNAPKGREPMEQMKLLVLPASELARLASSEQQTPDTSAAHYLRALVNPVGELRVIKTPNIEMAGYLLKWHNLEAKRRMVAIVVQARKQHVKPADIPTLLAALPPELADPYTGKPMRWDAGLGMLWVSTSSENL